MDATTNTPTNLPAGLEWFPEAEAIRCSDCSAWAYPGTAIRHSKRCDTPDLQMPAPTPVAAPAAPADSHFTSGSPKQIAWASDIRERLGAALAELDRAGITLSWVHADIREELARRVRAEIERSLEVTDAKTLIGRWSSLPRNREMAARQVIANLAGHLGTRYEGELREVARAKQAERRQARVVSRPVAIPPCDASAGVEGARDYTVERFAALDLD